MLQAGALPEPEAPPSRMKRPSSLLSPEGAGKYRVFKIHCSSFFYCGKIYEMRCFNRVQEPSSVALCVFGHHHLQNCPLPELTLSPYNTDFPFFHIPTV